MSAQNKPSKFLRFIGILLMGLTSAVMLLAGIGTTCVALGAENYPSMANLVEYKWLYQVFVLVTVLAAVYAVRATVNLVRRTKNAYRQAVTALAAGLLVNGIHMFASQSLRGSSAPVNFVVYITAFTLLVFLFFRIPTIWRRLDFKGGSEEMGDDPTAGAALIAGGLLTLTVNLWAGITHTWNGVNYADVWHLQLSVTGSSMLIAGLVFSACALLYAPKVRQQAVHHPGKAARTPWKYRSVNNQSLSCIHERDL